MNRFFGAMLLVSGMSIGTGMLALPVITSEIGFFPTILLLTVCLFFMLMTGFMLAEVNLKTSLDSNLISMSEKTLGKGAKVISWICYLFLFYSVQAAHIAASVPLLKTLFPVLPEAILPLGFVMLFGGFILAGTKKTDLLNRFVILGLIIGYILLIIFAPSHVDISNILRYSFKSISPSIPIIVISFGFQNIVPTICSYLHGDRKKIYLAIVLGCLLPFILYIFWEFIVIGSASKASLLEASAKGLSATVPLMQVLKTPLVQIGTFVFSLCAITTSFLGISLALIDFLSDGLRLPKNMKGRSFAFLLAFLFPIFFVYLYPQGFLYALRFAGVVAIILVGILPCLMAFKIKSFFSDSRGGKVLLFATLFFFIFVEIITLFN